MVATPTATLAAQLEVVATKPARPGAAEAAAGTRRPREWQPESQPEGQPEGQPEWQPEWQPEEPGGAAFMCHAESGLSARNAF